jgi:hypothetical protein
MTRTCFACGLPHPVGTTCGGASAPTTILIPTRIVLVPADMVASESHAREVIAAVSGTKFKNKFEAQAAGIKDDLTMKTRAFAAEIAGARATGLSGPHWEVLREGYRRRDKNRDIGNRTDVKQTARHDGYLWVRPGDQRGYLYLHVTGVGPEFYVWGWIEGADAMVARWRYEQPPYPAWRVPREVLLPLPMPEGA